MDSSVVLGGAVIEIPKREFIEPVHKIQEAMTDEQMNGS
jgi:hypothetical protein